MKRRYLIHMINHAVLLVDATPIGLATEVYLPEGKEQSLSSLLSRRGRQPSSFCLGPGLIPSCCGERGMRSGRAVSLS